ncbi:hypothetical protein EV643_107188 [Kribbella sp. VKM Ac-2527]|uniref:Polysaccharide deacetylase n=1 Tax=Kribbella caucasensis TaxID=2512215 RepID=A0A4R6KGI0_9ACTN|nr:hypothetical protein [Kribbella sp. VKM Ac-2527]TDO48559.1 hypothetical protein EV643_107188 [Kribbella sp. VKM Ac-2527]
MFEATHPFAFFDYFRVPYDVTGPAGDPRLGMVTAIRSGQTLYWLRSNAGRYRTGRYRIGDFTIACQLATGAPLVEGSGWRQSESILDDRGNEVAAVWRDDDGNVFLPFDPAEVMTFLWSERYTTVGSAGAKRLLRKGMVQGYYAVRPLLPRPLQLRMRRTFAKHQNTPSFPAWPIEHCLHLFYEWLLDTATQLAGEPVPWIDFWPDGRSWAMVLTHDVETAAGRDEMELLRGPERERGYRSSWNFVAERYEVTDETVARVTADGCEVGVHGLRHDGRDVASRRMLDQRLPAMRKHADRWGAVGFRSPATQRDWALMPTMGFDYDSSYTDTDPYEPQPGGCCTYLPFINGDQVELPITLPQDHTLFEILQHDDGELWVGKAREIRDRHGMVLVLAHPDYAHDDRLLGAWNQLLDEFANDATVWQALPREVSAWWRDRDASRLSMGPDGWALEGPAEGRGRVRHALLADQGA